MNGVSDEVQLEFAASEKRVLFTFNVGDFCRLHTEWMLHGQSHYGIITSDQLQFSIGERLNRLLRFVEVNSGDDLQDRLEFLSNWPPIVP